MQLHLIELCSNAEQRTMGRYGHLSWVESVVGWVDDFIMDCTVVVEACKFGEFSFLPFL